MTHYVKRLKISLSVSNFLQMDTQGESTPIPKDNHPIGRPIVFEYLALIFWLL